MPRVARLHPETTETPPETRFAELGAFVRLCEHPLAFDDAPLSAIGRAGRNLQVIQMPERAADDIPREQVVDGSEGREDEHLPPRLFGIGGSEEQDGVHEAVAPPLGTSAGIDFRGRVLHKF